MHDITHFGNVVYSTCLLKLPTVMEYDQFTLRTFQFHVSRELPI